VLTNASSKQTNMSENVWFTSGAQLPSILVIKIFSFLDPKSLCLACQGSPIPCITAARSRVTVFCNATANQTWRQLSEDETLWRILCKKRWGLKKKQESEYATHYCYWKFHYWLYLCKVGVTLGTLSLYF